MPLTASMCTSYLLMHRSLSNAQFETPSTNPDDTDATSSDFEMGICNVRGADHAEFGRTWGRYYGLVPVGCSVSVRQCVCT